MNTLIKFLSFVVVFFASYVQSVSPTVPDWIKYFMWFCCGSVFTHFLTAMLQSDDKKEEGKEDGDAPISPVNSLNPKK